MVGRLLSLHRLRCKLLVSGRVFSAVWFIIDLSLFKLMVANGPVKCSMKVWETDGSSKSFSNMVGILHIYIYVYVYINVYFNNSINLA